MADDAFYITEPVPFSETDEATYKRWYPEKRDRDKETADFEIALVLAGAVSAGAYSAGVMDYLFEALDRWYARRNEPDIPQHRVRIKIITGASAGGINGAIASTACRCQFPAITPKNAHADGASNPFYDAWVNRIDIRRLLDSGDLTGKPPRALLNGAVLGEIAERVVGFSGQPVRPGQRDWLDDPFQVLLTLSNLQGVPYWVRFDGASGLPHEMILHGDHVAFAVPVSKEVPSRHFPPDVLPLPKSNGTQDLAWQSLARTALATGAFPLALEPREIWHSPTDYEYRFPYLQVVNGQVRHIYGKPWPKGAVRP